MHDSSNIYNDPIESKPEKEQEFINSEKIFSSNHKNIVFFFHLEYQKRGLNSEYR